MEQNEGNYIQSGNIYINNPSECFICKRTGLQADAKYCPGCGFPQNGGQEEQKDFYVDYFEKSALFLDAKKKVKSAQNILFVASGLSVFSGLVLTAMDGGTEMLIAGFGMGVIFLGLGFWARRKPLAASVSGLVIYLTLILLSLLNTFQNGWQGHLPFSLWDILIVAFLAKGIAGALKAEKLKKEKGWDWNTNP